MQSSVFFGKKKERSNSRNSSDDWSFMSPKTEAYFIEGFLIRWSCSTLHQSIYLSRRLEFRNKAHITERDILYVCMTLGKILNINAISFLGKKNKHANIYHKHV